MIEYLKTTSLILVMVFLLSIVFAGFFSLLAISSNKKVDAKVKNAWPIPALIAAPTLIAFFFWVSETNVMFPSLFEADFIFLLAYTILPAFVLLVASGMLVQLWTFSFSEASRWREAPFFKFSQAMGVSRFSTLGRLVFLNVLIKAWLSSLPWIFGELIVVEAMFNAPGLGLDIWHFAKMQDTANLLHALAWLIGLYCICFALARRFSVWIGERLQSYA
jgi:ABC-type dipeptide/oligopeptide/nickel transport system permease component